MRIQWTTLLFFPLFLGASPSSLAATAGDAATRELGIEERARAQEAIEHVYWSHRIWPKENGGEKPALETLLSSSAIRSKVEDYLRKSNTLETWWGRPITSAQLQAEMDRMARASRQPEVLRELLAALGDDPFIAAECLARPLLVDRLIRSWYAQDRRFHGALEEKVRAAEGRPVAAVERMNPLSARHASDIFPPPQVQRRLSGCDRPPSRLRAVRGS